MLCPISSITFKTALSWFGSQVVIGEPPVATGWTECLMMYSLVNRQWRYLNSAIWSRFASINTAELESCIANFLTPTLEALFSTHCSHSL